MESKDVKKTGSWHAFYQANTKRWADPDKPFINVGVVPVKDYVYDVEGNRTDEVKSLGYWVVQVVTTTGRSDGDLTRYSNPILVKVDGNKELSLQMGDTVMFDGLASYYVKGFKRNNVLYRGHVNFRADGIRKVNGD